MPPRNFASRLVDYYESIARALCNHAEAAAVFPNPSNVGGAREQIYAEFLRQHLPARCNIFPGGYLFGSDGSESCQIDLIVTTDTTPRFDFHLRNGSGQSFAPVDGTLAAFSIKSTLTTKELDKALHEFASIPAVDPRLMQVMPSFRVKDYADWPKRILYASNARNPKAVYKRLIDFYVENPEIPIERRPHVIHVAGSFAAIRSTPQIKAWNRNEGSDFEIPPGEYLPVKKHSDVQAMLWVTMLLQDAATATSQM